MINTRYSSLSLVAFMASMSLGSALADSTDDALNQFYVDNIAAHLSSEGPATVSENPPQGQKGVKEEKGRKGGKTHTGSGVPEHSNQTLSSFFNYRSSAAVTNKVHLNFISSIPAKYPKLKVFAQKELADSGTEKRFDERFSRYGFSSRDSSDSYAGFLIVMWEIVNNQSASAHPAGIRQIRQKINELLLSKFGSKTVPDATKQYYSEYFKLLAVCYRDALKNPDSVDVPGGGGVEGIRSFAYQNTRKLGIDFKKFRLTDSGFQKI
jgi:hypothetical protein